MSNCTCGPCTSWCPVHGTCTCPRHEDGGMIERQTDETVILHGLKQSVMELVIASDCPIRHDPE
jgi:hypothetical protein